MIITLLRTSFYSHFFKSKGIKEEIYVTAEILESESQIFCILKNCGTYFFSISSLLFGIHVIIFYFQPLLILSRGGSRPWAKRGVRRVVVVCRLLCQLFFRLQFFFKPKIGGGGPPPDPPLLTPSNNLSVDFLDI